MNKKASIIDLVLWVVIALVVMLFLGLWLYGQNILTNAMTNIPTENGVNISGATQDTLGKVNVASNMWLPILAFVIMLCEGLSILVGNFYVKEHPVLFIPYILIVCVSVILSVYLSNVYEGLMQDASFGATLQTFTAGSFILLHLPLWTAIIGIFGAILLFAGIIVDKDSGNGLSP